MSLQDSLESQLRLVDEKEPPSGAGASSSSKPSRSRPPRVDSPAVQLSKALSYLLRHGAAKEGLKMRPDGFVLVSDILARPKVAKLDLDGSGRAPTLKDVKKATEDNEKKRFEMREEGEGDEAQWWIRATQGHSLKEVTDVDMIPVTLENYVDLLSLPSSSSPAPAKPTILHGTTAEAWEKIRAAGGLSRMGRNHIHLAKGRPGQDGVISGMRASSSVLLHIDVEMALRDGVSFLVASNGAVLTPGVKMGRPVARGGGENFSEAAPTDAAMGTEKEQVPPPPRAIQPPEDPEEKKRRREAAKKEKKERKMGGGGGKGAGPDGEKVEKPKKQQGKGGKKGADIDWDGMLPLKYVSLAEGKNGEVLWKREE